MGTITFPTIRASRIARRRCLRLPGRTFRNDIFEDYKANRSAPDADLRPQFALCRAAARAFGLPCIEEPGFEADDLIATWAGIADDCGAETVVVTSDKDMMQVVTARTKLFMPGHKAEIPWKWCGPDEVVEKFGVPPDRVADVLAIAGDTVDNVPGVKGIGEKGAADLIRRYDNLHAILCAPRSDKKAAMVMDAYDAADLSYRLVTLERDAPIYMTPDDLAYSAPDAEKVMAFLKAMEPWSLARKIGSEAGVNPDDVEPDAEFMARSAA